MDLSKTHIQLVERVYKTLESNIAEFKARKGNSLTLAERKFYMAMLKTYLISH